MSWPALLAVEVDPRVARAGQLGDAFTFAILSLVFAFFKSKKMTPQAVIRIRILGAAAFGILALLKALGYM